LSNWALGNVVVIASIVQQHVQVAQRVAGERVPELFDEWPVEGADLGRGQEALNTSANRRRSSHEVASANFPSIVVAGSNG
jgi:hypothetical protein